MNPLKNYRLKWWRPLMAGLLFFSLAGLAQAAEFSATIVTKIHGQERQGKIYVKGDKIRREFATSMGNMVTIVRGDKKVVWMLLPGQEFYREMPFDKNARSRTLNLPEDEVSKKLVGTETVSGYVSDKYETSVTTGAGAVQGTVWIAKKLEVPIRTESKDPPFSQEYTDIKEGGVDDAVFELPPGYKKMDMPGPLPQQKK